MMEVLYRPFQPEDGAGVVAVLRSFYGDDYYHAACYDPDYLAQCSRDGRRMIYVAEAPGDGVVGVADGYYRAYFPGSYELGMHVVRKEYQGRGIGRALLDYAVEHMRGMKIYGIYGMPVTFYDRSQKECEALGLPATGFWLGRYRANRTFFAEKPRSPKLHSLVVAAPGTARNLGPLHVPERHRAFVAEVYGSLRAPFDFAEDGERLSALSSYYVKDVEDAANREVYVRSVGRDLVAKVRELTQGCTEETSHTLFLNLLDRGCAGAMEQLAELGFYFTGVHPLHDHCEYAMLHRECLSGYAWDELQLTPRNQALLAYLLQCRSAVL